MAIKKGRAADAVSKLFSGQAAHEAYETQQAYEACDAHDAREAYEAHEACEAQDETAYSATRTQGKKGRKAVRMTMAFSDENMEYIRAMGRLERGGATAYVNRLIEADRRKNAVVYAQMKALKESQV